MAFSFIILSTNVIPTNPLMHRPLQSAVKIRLHGNIVLEKLETQTDPLENFSKRADLCRTELICVEN